MLFIWSYPLSVIQLPVICYSITCYLPFICIQLTLPIIQLPVICYSVIHHLLFNYLLFVIQLPAIYHSSAFIYPLLVIQLPVPVIFYRVNCYSSSCYCYSVTSYLLLNYLSFAIHLRSVTCDCLFCIFTYLVYF